MGLIVVPIATIYNNYVKQLKINETRNAQTDVRNAINIYIPNNGRYPRPAKFNVSEGDTDFGAEGVANPALCSSASWFATDGLCRTDNTASAVLIGAVPFNALGMSIEGTKDYWGNPLLYAVSLSQTDALTYGSAGGSVTVQVLDPARDPVNLATNYDMLVVSFGETAKGGYSNAATLISPCVGSVAENEDENCDFDDTFLLDRDPDNIENSTYSEVAGQDFFDDFTLAQDTFPRDIWYQHEVDPNYVISQATRVGVGTTDPQARLHVMGDTQVDTNIQSNQICNSDVTACFNPEIIDGNVPDMDCRENTVPGEEPVLSIGNSRVYCASAVDPAGNAIDGQAYRFDMSIFTAQDCQTTGQLMQGIDASGRPVCVNTTP